MINSKNEEKQISYFLDGKEISFKEFLKAEEQIKESISISPGVFHSFTNTNNFEDFLKSQKDFWDLYKKSEERLAKALKIIDIIGIKTLESVFNYLGEPDEEDDVLTDEILDRVSNLENIIGSKELDAFYKIFLSPKVGTARFYKRRNYRRRFCRYKGIFHVHVPRLSRSNNDKLSSLQVIGPCCISLFQHSWWRGARRTFGSTGGSAHDRFEPDLGRFNFDNRCSSWWFWV